jgi:DNA-binding transcriptional ArsR family regulator
MGHVSAPSGRDPASSPLAVPSTADDDIFKALADPSRRLLLDSLLADDGQSLVELATRLPSMTRFGVMKHLKQLESSGLLSSRKVGREKLHYLNPLPIRLIHARWLTKYVEPVAETKPDLSDGGNTLDLSARQ